MPRPRASAGGGARPPASPAPCAARWSRRCGRRAVKRPSADGSGGRWMRVRVLLLAFLLLALFGVVLGRAAKVQLLDRSRLARLQRDQTRRELEWAPRRGMILDRRGQPLAGARGVGSLF